MMNRVLIDTCSALDMLLPQRSRHDATRDFMNENVFDKNKTASVLSSSLKDMYYIIDRQFRKDGKPDHEKNARMIVASAVDTFVIEDLTLAIVNAALASDEPDFEDALIRATAEAGGFDLIVTSDTKAFKNSTVEVVVIE